MLIRSFYQICQRCLTEVEGNVQEVVPALLAVVWTYVNVCPNMCWKENSHLMTLG